MPIPSYSMLAGDPGQREGGERGECSLPDHDECDRWAVYGSGEYSVGGWV